MFLSHTVLWFANKGIDAINIDNILHENSHKAASILF